MSTAHKYFLPYQVGWIRDSSHLRICEKSRQVGLSYADSYDSVCKAARRPGRNVWVMSRDEAQARQYIRYCKHWARVLHCAAQAWGRRLFSDRQGKAFQVQTLSFCTGASIYALSSNPDAIVGKSGHVKLDEFALHKDQRTLYAVAKPVIQWGGSLSIISTHRGIGTVFYELLADLKQRAQPASWSIHTIPIQTAVDQGLVERINLKTGREESRDAWLARQRSECIDEEQWLQEYCCVPADESAAFISYELLQNCEEPALQLWTVPQLLQRLQPGSSAAPTTDNDFDHERIERPDPVSPGPTPFAATQPVLFLGVDIARKHDLCVFDLGERVGDVVWDRLRVELANCSFSEIKAQLYALLRLPQLQRCCLDATGLGMQLAEEARADFGWKIEPITFTAAVKEELAFGLRHDLQERRVRLVCDDRLRCDLRGIRKEVSLGGHIRFLGESRDSHCDRFWAKALRQHAARGRDQVWALVG